MNKEQIIKRMNPEQLAKLNGPKTEVADNIKQYPLTPDEMLPPVRKGNIIKGLGPNGTDIYSIDVGGIPDGMEFEEFIKLRKEEIDIEEGLKTAKLGVIDFHQTPPEFIDGKEFSRIDGPLNNVVGKMTGPNEHTYEGTYEELRELKIRMNEEDYSWGNVNDLTEYEVHLDVNGKVIDTKEIKPVKLGPGLREQLKDEAFTTQFNSPLDAPTSDGPAVSLPRTKKKKHRR